MAVTKLWAVRGSTQNIIEYADNPEKTRAPESVNESGLEAAIEYATNGEKTEKKYFVSGINVDPKSSVEEFNIVKRKFNKTDGIVAYHGYQSFSEGEVTPEIAHKIGCEYAKKVWGNEYQVIVATHLNTSNLHNHFIVNSISFVHGRRCREKTWRKLSKVSDEICKAHGLSVIENNVGSRIPLPLYKAEQAGKPTRLNVAKEAIDDAISKSLNMREFEMQLKQMGYFCQFDPKRKYWTVKQKDWQRPIRIARLGDDYTKEAIRKRIEANPPEVRQVRIEEERKLKFTPYNFETRKKRIRKHKGIKGLYLRYCYELGTLPKYRQNYKAVNYTYRDDLLKLNNISAESKLLVENNISSDEELKVFIESLQNEMDRLIERRNMFRREERRKGNTPEQNSVYAAEREKLTKEIKIVRREMYLCESIEERSKDLETKLEKNEREIKIR